MKRFEGKIALVTGGANGLGENLARRLVSEGAKVIIADIEEDTIKTVCDSMPDDFYGIVCDVSNKASVDAMVEKAVARWGRIDILFNNAGIGIFKNFLDLTEDDWRRVIDVNLTGEFLVGQAVAKAMIKTGTKGVIVNITASPDIDLDDIDKASTLIHNAAHPDVNLIWGVAFDESLEDEICITVIATDFDHESGYSIPTVPSMAGEKAEPAKAASASQEGQEESAEGGSLLDGLDGGSDGGDDIDLSDIIRMLNNR